MTTMTENLWSKKSQQELEPVNLAVCSTEHPSVTRQTQVVYGSLLRQITIYKSLWLPILKLHYLIKLKCIFPHLCLHNVWQNYKLQSNFHIYNGNCTKDKMKNPLIIIQGTPEHYTNIMLIKSNMRLFIFIADNVQPEFMQSGLLNLHLNHILKWANFQWKW